MSKHVTVDFSRCKPEKCNEKSGECLALQACTHKLLVQEARFEVPILLSSKMCVGCGDCIKKCPLDAIQKSQP